MEQAIRHDEHERLLELIAGCKADTSGCSDKLVLNLLQRAIHCRSPQCIVALLSSVDTLIDEDDINKRNCIHRLVITIGRTRALDAPHGQPTTDVPEASAYITAAELPVRVPTSFVVEERDASKTLGKDDPFVKTLSLVLDNLHQSQRPALLERDVYGRLPLHYSAQYGLVAASEVLIKHMQDWHQFDVTQGIDSEAWQDLDGFAPLHLSVIGGHYRTSRTLLEAEKWHGLSEEQLATRRGSSKTGAVLALATKSDYWRLVQLLVDAGVNVNFQDEHGETALHVAARFGFEECVKVLTSTSGAQKADLEIAEKTFGWTPLFIAAVEGHSAIVELLIAAGAVVNTADQSGWRPVEHAALRGHLDIATRLAEFGSAEDLPSPTLRPVPPSPSTHAASLEDRRATMASRDGSHKAPEPVKSFGHRYLTNESIILVSLGSMDPRKTQQAVTLDSIPLQDAHATQLDTALSIVISALGANGEPTVIDLPVAENISTSPITFMSANPTKTKLLFDLVPTYAGSKDKIVGRGVAMLSSIKPSIGSKRTNLQGDLSVPIMAATTLDVIGYVNFNFLIITPFSHPNMSITENQTYWKRTSTMVIGHRGLGKNMAAMKSLQLGENTIQSFIAAANLGASYVEFDVQLTKDLVPVIYHDFLVSETGIDAPVHTLTLEQFLNVNEGSTPRTSRPPSPPMSNGQRKGLLPRYQRSYSVGAPEDDTKAKMEERMKHTRDYKMKGFKANSRGNVIQAPFATLEEMFKKLPQSTGFNIEMKYPMLAESEAHDMDTYAVELNEFVDTVLNKVYELGNGRNIIFSSFHPDICLLLSFKQPSIPILFLTDAGTAPVGDIRASSLQEAIRFASRWNLLGVVSAAEPLVTCPRLVRVVKESGLVCVSYGSLNNNTEHVATQVKEGIDAVIVDSVLAIRKGLTAQEAAAAAARADVEGNGHLTPASMPTEAIPVGTTLSVPAIGSDGRRPVSAG